MKPLPWIRKLVVLVIGGTLLLIGLALLFLPGPGTVVGGIGLAILATEFWWARWMVRRAKAYAEQFAEATRYGSPRTAAPNSGETERAASTKGRDGEG